MNLVDILWLNLKFLDQWEEKINAFTAKYVSSPMAGYAVFGILLFLAVVFIKEFANK